jgi:hypothetical protein
MKYACTYLREWEQELFEKSDRLPTHYWRYVDDVWGLWELSVSFEKNSVWINPSFILILTSKNSICCEEKRNSVLICG